MKRRTKRHYLGAIRHVQEGHSQREAAALYGITRSVLQKYLKWDEDNIPDFLTSGKYKPVFSPEQERMIVDYAIHLAHRFYAMTRRSLGELAFRLAEENQIAHVFRNGTAGEDWVIEFLIRHQDQLSTRTGTPTSLIRIKSFTRSAVHKFFDELEKIILKKGYNAATIFNADETGVAIVSNRSPRRIARKGIRYVPVLVPAERGTLVTFTCCFSAKGWYIPPMYVFPENAEYTYISLAPPGSLFTKSKRGWSTSKTFLQWIKHFRQHATPGDKEKDILLIVDNHSTHISHDVVMYASKHHIDILTIPPHCTHKLQPLDVAFFSPLKSRYGAALTSWLATHMGRRPRNEDIQGIIKSPYEESCKESTAINGFRKTGIWLEDMGGPSRDVFQDEEFAKEDPPPENIEIQAGHGPVNDNGDDAAPGNDEERNDVPPTNNDAANDDMNINEDFVYEELYSSISESSGLDENAVCDSLEDSDHQIVDRIFQSTSEDSPAPCSSQLNKEPHVETPISDTPPVDILKKIQIAKSLVPYVCSSSEDSDDECIVENGYFGIPEAADSLQGPSNPNITNIPSPTNIAVNSTPFVITPWNIGERSQCFLPEVISTRKKRAPGTSVLATSEENLAKLREKHKKRKKVTSSSEESRITRSLSKASKRNLRSSGSQ